MRSPAEPAHPRPFKTPLMPWVPLLGILGCFGLMAYLPLLTWIRFVVWSAIGIAVYFGYSIKHSRLNVDARTSTGSRL